MEMLRKILSDELELWKDKYKKSENNLIIHGGLCEVEHLINNIEKVDREYLLDRYNKIKNRKKETELYELAEATKLRDKARMEAIVSIGTKLKQAT